MIFLFFNMATAVILDFKIGKISLADGAQRAQSQTPCQMSSKSVVPLQRYRNFFLIFKMAITAILDFGNR